jgi:transaldolase
VGACDLFRKEWERSDHRDGWASIEVSPRIAYDVEATVAEVREWVKRVDRDNLFVKVPATSSGVSAIERLTAEGISINVTLVFSLDRYREIAEAYISGLEPHNVDPRIGGLSGIRLLSLDDVAAQHDKNSGRWLSAAQEAERIVTESVEVFLDRRSRRSLRIPA